MPAQEVQNFFQGFNFDTLLALISCIAGVVALFLGGTAYKNCRIIKNSFNDKKKFEDNSQDHSQRAAGDIINNGVTDTQLMTITTALTTISNNNFSKAVDQAYATFRLQTDENMRQIISEAERIVKESKWQIAGYTKLDWINIYFESAKNASDPHMQKVWAKVLATEMSVPGTFSFKTLDVLKNMSCNEFVLFDQLASTEIHGAIIKHDGLKDLGFNWSTLQRLKDYGLLSLDGSQREIAVKAGENTVQIIRESHLIVINSKEQTEDILKAPCYLLTTAAQELLSLTSVRCNDTTAINIANALIKADKKQEFEISLHQINCVYPDGRVNYSTINLLKTN